VLRDDPDPAPMAARLVDTRHLLLFRTVARRSRAYRQGLVLDAGRLTAWLDERALGSTALDGRASLRFHTRFDPTETIADRGFVYRRRFAEPFSDLGATLSLDALPGLGGGEWIMALSIGIVLVCGFGLFALYRMVSVALRFAERRSNFAAAVSHELKTPLTAIRMYAEMLRDGMVDSEAKRDEYYVAITSESERLSRLIRNVLEFSELEKGQRTTSVESGPLAPVLTESEQLLRAHVERQGFVLEVDCPADLPPARFDRDALLQILFNLIDNALKYAAGAQDRRILVRCEPDGDGVCVSVRDFGPGVERGQLSRIFQPFYRSEAELTRTTRGTGIGLALVSGLAQAMGARVRARNADPSGLRVELHLAAP
jgi:signal transduction histidine kinase